MSLTTDRFDPDLTHGVDRECVPQAKKYLVLSAEERAKGFVRPYRDSYRHVGEQPKNPLRDLTDEEHARYDAYGYAAFEAYPESDSSVTGRFWTQAQLDAKANACQGTTTMGRELSETYARDPYFYGATYCVHCSKHLPVAEFKWLDGDTVGS